MHQRAVQEVCVQSDSLLQVEEEIHPGRETPTLRNAEGSLQGEGDRERAAQEIDWGTHNRKRRHEEGACLGEGKMSAAIMKFSRD